MKEKCAYLIVDKYCNLARKQTDDGEFIYACRCIKGCYFKRLQRTLKENRKLKYKKSLRIR